MIRNRPGGYGRPERLGVWLMALALVCAAVVGAGMGLVWDYSGASQLFEESEDNGDGEESEEDADES